MPPYHFLLIVILIAIKLIYKDFFKKYQNGTGTRFIKF